MKKTMNLLEITEEWVKMDTVFYENTMLYRDKVYLMPERHIEQVMKLGFGKIAEGYDELPHLKKEDLKYHDQPIKALLFFDGGLGDAISVSILLDALRSRYNIHFDLICKKITLENIFRPFGLNGKWIEPPADLETVKKYQRVLTRVDNFFNNTENMHSRCIVDELGKAYQLDLSDYSLTYTIPMEIQKECRLPDSPNIRLGLNFDSTGKVKSYPEKLQTPLINKLIEAGFEIHLFGTETPLLKNVINKTRFYDYRNETTIPELAALLSQMDFVLCVDSLVAHLSDILGIKTFVLLSTTKQGIFNWHRNILCLESRIECSPCGEILNDCPREFEGCQAFFNESIRPDNIVMSVISVCAKHLQSIASKK